MLRVRMEAAATTWLMATPVVVCQTSTRASTVRQVVYVHMTLNVHNLFNYVHLRALPDMHAHCKHTCTLQTHMHITNTCTHDCLVYIIMSIKMFSNEIDYLVKIMVV